MQASFRGIVDKIKRLWYNEGYSIARTYKKMRKESKRGKL